MPLQPAKFYTMQVHLHRHYEGQKLIGKPIEFVDMTFDQVQQTKRMVWQQGITIELTPICFEVIDPLHIKTIYFLEQPAKFGVD